MRILRDKVLDTPNIITPYYTSKD